MATIQTTIELSVPAEDTIRLPVLGAAVAALQHEKWTLQRMAAIDGTIMAVLARSWKIEGAEEVRPPGTPEAQIPLLASTVFPQTPGFGPTLAEDAALVQADPYPGFADPPAGTEASTLPTHVHRFGEDGACLEPGCLGTREQPDGPGLVAADPAAPSDGQGSSAPVVTVGRRAGTRKVSRSLLGKGRVKRR
jgi:hypothetical protein